MKSFVLLFDSMLPPVMNETCKALTYNNILISCCIQPKLCLHPHFQWWRIHCCSLFECIWTLGGTLSCLEAREFASFEQTAIQMPVPSRPIELEFFSIVR